MSQPVFHSLSFTHWKAFQSTIIIGKTIYDIVTAGLGCLIYWEHFVQCSLLACSSLLVKRAPNTDESLTDCEYCAFFFLMVWTAQSKLQDVNTSKISIFWGGNEMRLDCKIPVQHKHRPKSIKTNQRPDKLITNVFALTDVGFVIPNRFVVGYALDYNEYFRDLNVSLPTL